MTNEVSPKKISTVPAPAPTAPTWTLHTAHPSALVNDAVELTVESDRALVDLHLRGSAKTVALGKKQRDVVDAARKERVGKDLENSEAHRSYLAGLNRYRSADRKVEAARLAVVKLDTALREKLNVAEPDPTAIAHAREQLDQAKQALAVAETGLNELKQACVPLHAAAITERNRIDDQVVHQLRTERGRERDDMIATILKKISPELNRLVALHFEKEWLAMPRSRGGCLHGLIPTPPAAPITVPATPAAKPDDDDDGIPEEMRRNIEANMERRRTQTVGAGR